MATGYVDIASSPKRGKKKNYWTIEKVENCYLNYLKEKRDEIEEQQNARRYRHAAQWTSAQVEIFNTRKQPIVTYNRIGRKIDSIVGLMQRMKQDPKAYPRNPRTSDEQSAELATAAVRYVVDAELKEDMFPFIVENAATDGIGGVEMILDEGEGNDNEISFAMVQPDSFFYDPRSYLHDFSDARFMGQGKWLDVEAAIEMFPDMEDEIRSRSSNFGSEFSSDPDRERRFFDGTNENKRVRVVDIWYRHDGGWCWCIFMGGLKLDEGAGYFYDHKNRQICKYIMFSAFVDHDGDRYGFVRNLKSSQDEINQRRSKGLHELVSRRIFAEDGAFADIELTRREAVRPDGVVIRQKGFEAEFDDQARIANVEGQLKFLEDAKNEIENFGPNPALIGQGLEYKSGRAINLLQQAGIAELGPFVIGLKNWKLRLYRAIWSAVQRYWNGERWIRVTNDEGIASFVQVNGMQVDPMTGMPQMVNQIGQLDVNFILEEGPDEVNMMADAYDTLIALTAQGANIPPEILLELAPLHASVKRKLLAILSKPDPIQEQAKMVAVAGEAAKVEETRSKAALNQAKAQQEAQGGAHGLVERFVDMKAKQQDHQMKLIQGQQKINLERNKARISLGTDMMKARMEQQKARDNIHIERMKGQQQLRQTELQGQQALRQTEIKGQQVMRQGEQRHQQSLKQQKAKPKPNEGKNGRNPR